MVLLFCNSAAMWHLDRFLDSSLKQITRKNLNPDFSPQFKENIWLRCLQKMINIKYLYCNILLNEKFQFHIPLLYTLINAQILKTSWFQDQKTKRKHVIEIIFIVWVKNFKPLFSILKEAFFTTVTTIIRWLGKLIHRPAPGQQHYLRCRMCSNFS